MENNTESLFEYQAGQPAWDNVWLSNDVNQPVGSFSAYYGYFDGRWPWSFYVGPPFIATQKLIDAIPKGL